MQSVPSEWRRLLMRRFAPSESPDAGVPHFVSVAGTERLALAPAGALAPSAPGWHSFSLRRAYPEEGTFMPTSAPYLLVVRVVAVESDRQEFRRWLDDEHCRLQVAIPGVQWYLGYEQTEPGHSFLNLWGIEDPAIVDSDAWSVARDTPWWSRVAHVPANAERGVYRLANPTD